MCEECGPIPPEMQEAFDEFEEAIKKFLGKTANQEGIMVDWVLVTSQSVIHTHTDSTMCGWSAGLNQPLYRTKGLMQEVLDSLQASRTATWKDD